MRAEADDVRDDMEEERAWCAEEKPSVVVGLNVVVKDVCVVEAVIFGLSGGYVHAVCLLASEFH